MIVNFANRCLTPNKTGKLEEKRIIKLQGKVLSPLSIESPSLPVGTKFKASITSDPASSVVATTLKGNTVTIKEIKNFGFAKREWTSQKINLEVSLLNYKGKEVPLAKIEGTPLGILDKESEKKLRELNLLNSTKRNLTFSVKLQTSASTSTNIQVKPETVIYPWQQKDKEKELEEKRVIYREQYETYAREFTKNPTFAKASRKEIDVEVTVRARADIHDKSQVMAILSQSDLVRE